MAVEVGVKLYAHQTEGARRLMANPRYALWWEMGTGKTATVLDAIRRCVENPNINLPPRYDWRALIVCPLAIIDSAWRRDAETFAPGLTFTGFHDRRPDIPFGQATLNVVNFESFRARFRRTFQSKIPRYDMLVIDESSKLKAFNSQTSKIMRHYAQTIERVVLLSGTPAPNDGLEYWSQMYCIDQKILGHSFYGFRYAFGKPERIYAPGARVVDKWRADPDKTPLMLERIATVSHTLRKEDCLDLPDRVDQTIAVELSPTERKAYDTMKRDLILRFGPGCNDVAAAVNVLAEIMKLRQLCNGWTYDVNHEAQPTGGSKLRALDELLEGIPNEPVIIWVEYREDAARLLEHFGPRATRLIGGMSNTERVKAILEFQTGKRQYLIAHPASAGHGLTFVNASYAVFYGLGYSYELHKQAKDRIHRIGQTRKCTYYYLLAADTIEQKILGIVRDKEDAAEVAMGYLRNGD